MAFITDNREEAQRVTGYRDAVRACIFESVSDFAAWAAAAGPAMHRSSGNNDASPEWDYSVGYQGAVEMAERGGWQEGADRLQRLSLSIPEAETVDVRKRRQRRVAGARPHAAAAAAGSPRSMVRPVRTEETTTGTRILRIVLPWGKASFVDGSACEHMGAALIECVDAAEAAGVRCEIVCQHRNEEGTIVRVQAKHAGEHVDRAALAFLIAHPAATRRLRFRANEGPDGIWPTGHYGHPGSQGAWRKAERESGALVLPYLGEGGSHRWFETMGEAREWMRERFASHLAAEAKRAAAERAA